MTDRATLYGIPNCDTVRKARRWLDGRGVDYRFHDLRADRIDPSTLNEWLEAVGADVLINRRSTTWKQLTETQRSRAAGTGAAELLADHPTLIKRPVLVVDAEITVGFSEARYAERLASTD
ncbi:MAG: arsenate reductase [Pseudomonadota bacterium]|nr:arsenate reductase [Pseudomonadota bacterium]